MTPQEHILFNLAKTSMPIINGAISTNDFIKLDLSVQNEELLPYDISDPAQCQAYIDLKLKEKRAQMALGGYLEVRNLYRSSPNFASEGPEERNIHLGLDIWAAAKTRVLVPWEGKIHSFANNNSPGDYGPTIILEHKTQKLVFYTLYGHLSVESLERLSAKQYFNQGELLATLGTPEENGHYAPHLHFQIILDLMDFSGDYPGVCTKSQLDYYKNNCPNPNILLKLY